MNITPLNPKFKEADDWFVSWDDGATSSELDSCLD